MAALQIKSFGGIAPKVPPRYLQDTMAQTALNGVVFNGSLQPLSNIGAAVHTLTKTGTPLTIYRFGQSITSDSQYWFHWTTDVNVCRSQISGDTSEWTFYTGDGVPKATYSTIALSGTNYPTVSRPLGVPAPTTAATLSVSGNSASASLLISSTVIASLSSGYIIGISLDGTTYTNVTVGTVTASAIAALINPVAGVAAVVEGTGVRVTRDDATPTAAFTVRYQSGTAVNTDGTFTYNAGLDKTDSGSANTFAYVVITESEIGSVAAGDVITVRTASATHTNFTASGSYSTASAFAAALNSASVNATAYGSCVVLTPGTTGSGPTDFIEYKRMTGTVEAYLDKVDGSEQSMPATIFLVQSDLNVAAGKYLAYTVNGGTEAKVAVPTGTSITSLSSLTASGVSITLYGSVSPLAVVTTTLAGTFASLLIRAGSYPSAPTYTALNSVTATAVEETRVYTYTVVNKESGFEFESAPAPASVSVDVVVGQTVTVSGFSTIPTGYTLTHRRIYRSTSGTFLFVAEIAIAATSFVDNTLAENLGEELPSLTWLPPPDTLAGLINLPNGIMAGFTGRDVYFCDPYHPHAWPVQYMQSVDFPVVGLGRMDTTLAVLTTGTPYFIQGSSPDAMVVVKSDLEQSCASKRSIVSTNNAVIYASPDGLVMLSSGGSKVLTEQMFTRAQWQATFNPSSIHAYQQDMKYVAFYTVGGFTGGFIYDLTTGQLILHTLYATAGYNDLQADKLYTAFSDRTVKIWQAGAPLSYTWKSKKFTMPKVMGFSCAQVEAEAYPVTAKIYSDNVLVHTQTVTSRAPFRLPVAPGLDWEFQIEGNTEVFNILMAQSMQELANG